MEIAKKLFKDTLALLIIVFITMYLSQAVFGINNPYLVKTHYYGQEMTYIDTASYFRNIKTAFTSFGDELALQPPPQQWISSGADIIYVFINNMKFIFNWFVYIIDILLYPFRLLAWVLRNIFVLLGFTYQQNLVIGNETYNPPWFMNILNWLAQEFKIPFII